jgi:hypothetical protein
MATYLVVYILSLIIFLYAFMFQRTTLQIARVLNAPISETQMILTPNWMGALGWVGTIGAYGVLILIWTSFGIATALLGLVVNLTISVILPIPYQYFFKMVLNHLNSEINKSNEEKQEAYKSLRESILNIEVKAFFK